MVVDEKGKQGRRERDGMRGKKYREKKRKKRTGRKRGSLIG